MFKENIKKSKFRSWRFKTITKLNCAEMYNKLLTLKKKNRYVGEPEALEMAWSERFHSKQCDISITPLDGASPFGFNVVPLI